MIREDNLANEDLGGYRITDKIISTTFSSTFLGKSISPKASYQNVVIELLYAAHTHNDQQQQDILQKIALLRNLRHPHIVPILSSGFHKDVPYIITEHLSSSSLYNRFQQRPSGQPLLTKEAFLILAHVGRALHYAHQKKMIHGSLKPQDVLFTLQDVASVTGFHRHALLPLDEAEEANSRESSIYRAPEQLAGQTNEKSDQYALGCLAYALFTGHQPFMVPSINTPGTYFKTRTLIAPIRLNSSLSLYIEEAILKAMAKEPDERYSDIDTFLAAMGIPPGIESSDLKETVAMLAQIMKGEFSKLPTPPTAEIDTLDTTKLPLSPDEIATRDGKRTNSDTFSHVPSDIIGQAKAVPFSDTMLPNAALTYAGAENQPPFNLRQVHNARIHPSFPTMGKSLTSRPRRTFAGIISLIVILIAGVTMLINLNFSAPQKRSATPPSGHSASSTNSSAQTTVPGSTVATARTRSSTIGITLPSRKATPQQTTVLKTTPVTAPASVPTTIPTSTPAQIQVALNPFFNNEGIGDAPGLANFDGSGYSYPANQLPYDKQIRIQGVPYQFPGNGPGTNDNITASGQTISFTPGNYRQVFFLAASSWGPVSGTVAIKYTDGSTSTRNLTVPDWYSNPGVLNTTSRYTPDGIDNHPVYIYAIAIRLDATHAANALILPQSNPNQNSAIHVFALTLLS